MPQMAPLSWLMLFLFFLLSFLIFNLYNYFIFNYSAKQTETKKFSLKYNWNW